MFPAEFSHAGTSGWGTKTGWVLGVSVSIVSFQYSAFDSSVSSPRSRYYSFRVCGGVTSITQEPRDYLLNPKDVDNSTFRVIVFNNCFYMDCGIERIRPSSKTTRKSRISQPRHD